MALRIVARAGGLMSRRHIFDDLTKIAPDRIPATGDIALRRGTELNGCSILKAKHRPGSSANSTMGADDLWRWRRQGISPIHIGPGV
jgi:hypothetical protein